MDDNMKLHTLGGLRILRSNGESASLGSHKAEAIFIYLACTRRSHSREALAELFWNERSQSQTMGNLRRELSALRQGMGELVDISRQEVGIAQDAPLWVDALELEKALGKIQPAGEIRDASVAEQVDDAVTRLYQGAFLEGFTVYDCRGFDEWCLTMREHYQRLAVEGLQALATYELECQETQKGLAHVERLLQLDPLYEDGHRLKMCLLALGGQRSAALKQYESCQQILKAELDIQPSEETRQLYQLILDEQLDQLPVIQTRLRGRQPSFADLPEGTVTFLYSDVEDAKQLLHRLVKGKLVARDQELNQVLTLWQRSENAQARSLLLSGEPGIGKTRLVRELALHPNLSQAYVFIGECYAEGNAPYAPFAQILQTVSQSKAIWRMLPTSVLADLLVIAPSLQAHFHNIPPNPPLEAQAEQQRVFDGVFTCFEKLAEQVPLLLVIEDIHWADQGTLALIRSLARRLPRQAVRLLLVLTYRESELSESSSLKNLLADLQRERLAEHIKLSRLNREHTCDLLAELFKEEITPEFLEGIYYETEGNPFFVEEVCKALIDTGQVYRSGDRWQRPPMSEIQVPQNIRMAIETRLNRLPEMVQNMLCLAAVIGREFDFKTLKTVGDFSENTLLDVLESAERAQIITETRSVNMYRGETTFTFTHALILQTLYEGLSSMRRRLLHQRIGYQIERLNPDRLDELSPQLSHHFCAASEWDKAVHYLLKAGESAQAVFATAEAIDYYQQALVILKNSGNEKLKDAARIAMKLGQLHHILFEYPQACQAYQEAFDLWQSLSQMQASLRLPSVPHSLRLSGSRHDSLLNDPALDPNTDQTTNVINQLLCGLVELTLEMDIAPSLAQRWEISPDGRHYVFYLRYDVCWSDGEPLTAEDFEYSWKRAIQPAMNDNYAQFFFDIQGARAYHQGQLQDASQVGVRALDRYTLAVDLEEPVGHFLYLAAFPILFPLPKHIVEKYGSDWISPQHIACSGPFILASHEPRQSMMLVRNPAYHGSRSGNLESIHFTFLAEDDPESLLELYRTDQLDVIELSLDHPEFIARCRQIHASEYASQPLAGTLFLILNPSRPPFDDIRVRRAFAHTVDYQLLNKATMGGFFSPERGGIVPPGVPGHSPGIELPYNPEAARRLLAEAGYPDGRGFPEIEYCIEPIIGATPGSVDLCLIQQWRDILGISVHMKRLNWVDSQLQGVLDKQQFAELADIYRIGWSADYLDPDSFLRMALNQCPTAWFDPEYHTLLETVRSIPAQSERLKFYRAADRLLVENARIVPLGYLHFYLLIKPWVKQYPTIPLGLFYLKDVILEAH